MAQKCAAIDWLTMTTDSERVGMHWHNVYRQYRQVRRQEGNEEKQFHNGYYGGLRIDHMSVGHSDTIGYIVIVSGRDADLLFLRLMPGKHKVTRIDLAFDFEYEFSVPLADKLYLQLSNKALNQQRKFSKFSNSEGGATFYLGSRQSTQFGRVYDKGVEGKTREPGYLWRAEVEYKKPLSGIIANKLAQVSSDKRELVICNTVCEWFADRGTEVFPRGDTGQALHVSVETRITTADRKLSWLRSQVSPSVATLISAGYGKEVLKVLGLDIPTINEALMEVA